jgi:dolichol-phosphate mannosyltransferase
VSETLRWLLATLELVAIVVVAPRLWRASRGGARLDGDRIDGARLDATVGEAAAESVATPRISVVVPARNESQRIAECLAPLRGAPGVLEVIVVDDESSDDTAAIAEANGARVMRGAPLPPGWVGKIWALKQGIEAARGDIIVTLDADARPDARLPITAARQLLADGAAMATVAPKFRTSSAASQWLHAAMLVSLVYRHAAGAATATSDAVANGQCMVLRRDEALRDDWCGRVSGEIIEDVALVRMLVRDGKRVSMFDGTNLLVVAMFDGFADTWRGWGRSLALGGVDRRPRQWWDALVTLVVLAAPVWLFAAGVATPLTAAAILLRLGTLVGAHRAYERPGVGYWLSPFADLLAWFVVVGGIASPSREWRGREY